MLQIFNCPSLPIQIVKISSLSKFFSVCGVIAEINFHSNENKINP